MSKYLTDKTVLDIAGKYYREVYKIVTELENKGAELPISSIAEIVELIKQDYEEEGAEQSWRHHNVGESDYSQQQIQPWDIWKEYKLNPWDADVIKRILRKKGKCDLEILGNRLLDYRKIIHICQHQADQISEELRGKH